MNDRHRAALSDGMARLTRAINRFDRTLAEHADHLTWQDAALGLRLTREQVTLLQAAAGYLEARVIIEGVRDAPVPGVGIVTVNRPKNRKNWDHDGLASNVLDRHLTRLEGNVPDPWTVRDWLIGPTGAAGVGYWRVGVCRELGIDVDQFCDSTPGTSTVQITHGKAPARPL